MKYIVHVCRTRYAYLDVEVEADSASAARGKAIHQAQNTVMSDKSSEYHVADMGKIKEKEYNEAGQSA